MSKKTKVEYRRGESLEQTEGRFRRWREGRRRGARIPMALWGAAGALAERYGVERIAQQLRVDEQRLTKHVQRAGAEPGREPGALGFVELLSRAEPPRMPGTLECVVELANARGGKMRIELSGPGLGGLSNLCSAFWEAP